MAAYCKALVSSTIILRVSYFNERHDIRIPQQTAFLKDMYGSWQAYSRRGGSHDALSRRTLIIPHCFCEHFYRGVGVASSWFSAIEWHLSFC
jgi:hypothetical protein